MIENYLLEELVAFAENGTLNKAAEKLNLSQPAITRGTKKLETELGITLFDRTPNKISLNETGKYAAEQAKKVLTTNQKFISQVRNFDNSYKEISIASIAPGPLIVLKNLEQKNLKIADTLLKNQDLESLLLENQFTCVVSNQPIKNSKIESAYLGMEHLIVQLNEFTNLASKKNVTFKELEGLSFLVLSYIGIWKEIIQDKIPDAKFLYQNDEANFNEIKNYSVFPFFTTNITRANRQWSNNMTSDRTPVEISDKEATQVFYANFLKENKKRLEPVVENWQGAWEKVD